MAIQSDPPGDRRILLLLAALILTGLGVIGVFGNTMGYTDALYEPDYTIVHAPEEGPLADAGFLPGDSVLSVEGIPVVDLGMYSRWPRSLSRRPGESITMVVDRDGERVSGEIVYREVPAGSVKLQAGALVVLLAFLWAGVWAVFTVSAPEAVPHAHRLGALGLAAGLSIQAPSAGSWNGVVEHIHMAAMVLWTLLLLRFFLRFPRPKRIGQSHLTTLVIFLPWLILLGCLAVELIFHPRFYHSFGWYFGLLLFLYFALGLIAFLHSWAKTPRDEMGPSGMSFALAGVGVGVGGILVWITFALLFPALEIPGINWAPVLLAAMPIGLALGVKKAALRE